MESIDKEEWDDFEECSLWHILDKDERKDKIANIRKRIKLLNSNIYTYSETNDYLKQKYKKSTEPLFPIKKTLKKF